MESRDGKGNWRAGTGIGFWIACVSVVSITCVPTAIAQTRVDEGAVRITTAVEAEIRDARLLGVPTLAPKAFAGADEAYRGLLRDVAAGLNEEKARVRGEAIKGELRGAFERAEKTKAILGRSHKSREELHRVQGLKPDEAKLREAERAYANAVQAAEAGDEASAKRAAGEAATAYRAALIEPFLRGELAELEKKIGEARAGRVAPEVIARARRDLDQIRAEVERARGEDLALGGALADWHGKLDVIIGLIYPPFFTKPPAVIRLGNWELVVERYATRSWDFVNGVIIHAYGTAWISFDCGGLPLQPILPGIAVELVPWTLRVVSAVRDPAYEIAIEEAMKIDPRAEVGRSLELNLPKERDLGQPIKAAKLAAELRIPEGLLGGILLPTTKGQVLVLFEDLTIEPTPLPKVGHATAGTASYPAIPRIPTELVFTTAGFRLHLDTLTITTTTTTASARLEMPSSIIDGGGCRVAEIPLGTITLDSSCRYHGEFLALAWGPWIIGDTGMVVQGTGLIVDLDDNWTWPGWTGPPQGNVWQGVMLPGGATIGVPSGSMTSNIAYLRAAYSFTNGMITGGGLAAFFQLTSPFRFKTLLPYGFDVALENGFLRMQNSRIQSGSFIHGGIDFPKLAVSDGAGGGVKSSYTLLSVQEDLDLFAEIDVKSDVFWGEYVNTSPPQNAYSVNDPRTAYFFTSGRYLDPKLPVGPGGFEEPGPMFPIAAGLESKQIHGAFLMAFEQLLIHSRDVPAPPNPIKLRPVGTSWVNVVGQGVHASFDLIVRDPPDASVGPQWQTTYVGKAPFHLIWEASPEKPRIVAEFRFVDSAVYRSEGRGQIDVKGPTNAMIPFNRLAATSTAHLPGASIDLTNPIVLAYWGLGVVAKPGFTSAGVMSVKTGQIVLTAAGLTEVRHFAAPFWMTWMEILANGELGRIFFDFNGSGQQFDGFPFTLKAIGLSTWDPADATGEKAFLQAGGTAHFDFFGADYLNVKDFKNPTKLLPPFDGRKIELATDTAFGTEATDFTIAGQWGNGFGHAAYTIAYDDVDQDGFLGTGTFGVDLILDGDMASTITMARDLICMRVSETTRHDFKAGPVAHFGSMSRISGCACVEDGQLKRLLISSELEATGNVNVALRSGAYGKVEYLLTPDVSELRIRGNLYLSVVIGGDVEVNGAARFVVNRAEDFVEGEVEGSFSSYRLLSGLTAEGKLNWHLGSLGPEGYEVIQGRVIVNVISPVGGSGVEGGFFIGQNAPKEKAWILKDKDGRFDLNVSALPATLTGIYGYVRWERSVNLWVVSGGVEIFAALGGFVNVGGVPQVNSGAGPGVPVALPFVVGNFGVRIWGEIAGGLLSASAWGNFQVIAPYPFQFQGTLGLEGCVVWVACASVDVTAGVNSADGFYVE